MTKIAIIGTGISGLASAWILSQEHDVTVYEKADYVGGHTNTRKATFGTETVWADTGFMVFNHRTYPHLISMFEYFEIETVKTNMSFGVSSNGGDFEFCTDNPFVTWRNLFSVKHWKLILNIVRFNKTVEAEASKEPDECTLRDLLDKMNLGAGFQDRYLLPLSGAIWSTNKNNILDFPAKKFVSFFNNHGLLFLKTVNPLKLNKGKLQWYTVKNGSQQYVKKILAEMNADVHRNRAVSKITRSDSHVVITDSSGTSETFDHVVCAAHPDQTLKILTDASSEERRILGNFEYNENLTVMHKDTSFMLKQTTQWPSWTYTDTKSGAVELSYYMNRLQLIPESKPIVVTLNPSRKISEEDIFYETVYRHPLFTISTQSAQEELKALQGTNNTWFAGAWTGHGFHEDGLQSAVSIGEKFNLTPPWERTEM